MREAFQILLGLHILEGPQRLPNLHFFLFPFRRFLHPKFFSDFPVQAIPISQIHTAADLRESLVVSLLYQCEGAVQHQLFSPIYCDLRF